MTGCRAVLATVVVALVGAGCGGPATVEADTVEAGAAVADPGTVIEFWYMPNGPQSPAETLGHEAEEFSRQHPGITVELTELPWESALTKIITAATSGSGPDVLQIGTTWVPGIAALGALDAFAEADLERIGGSDAFVASSWTSTQPIGMDATVAVPWFLDTRAGFYRTDLFEDLGLDPAEAFVDWEAFERTLAAIAADGRMHPMSVSGANDWNVVHDLAPWIWAAGGDFLTEASDEPAVTSPEVVHGIDTYQRLVAEYNHPDALALDVGDAQELFVNGEAAITFGGPSVVNDLRTSYQYNEAAVEGWATAWFPSGPHGRQAFLGGSNLAIFSATEDRDAALAWISFLTSEESQLRYVSKIGMLPARHTALNDDLFLADPGFRPFVEQLAYGRQYPALPEWLHVEVALQHHVGRLWREVAARDGALTTAEVEDRMAQTATDVRAALSDDG